MIIVTAEVQMSYSAATWGVPHVSLMNLLVEYLAFLLREQEGQGLDVCADQGYSGRPLVIFPSLSKQTSEYYLEIFILFYLFILCDAKWLYDYDL